MKALASSPKGAASLQLAQAEFRVGTLIVRKRGKKGLYTADGWFNDKHVKRALKTTNKGEAQRRATQLLFDLTNPGVTAALKISPSMPTSAGGHLIVDVIATFMAWKVSRLKKGSLAVYRGALDAFATHLASIQIFRIDQITAGVFDAHLQQLSAAGLSKRTIQNRSIILFTWGKWVAKRDYALRSPFYACELPKVPKATRFTPSFAQIAAMLQEASTDGKRVLMTLACTGLRIGELIYLRPKDIDLDKGLVQVRARQTPHPWSTKSDTDRVVPIAAVLQPFLEAQLASAAAVNAQYLFGPIFSRRDPANSCVPYPKPCTKLVIAAAKTAGLPMGAANSGFVIHSLRRYFKTRCLLQRVNSVVLDRWMGHHNPTMSEIYFDQDPVTSAHLIDDVAFV